MDGYIPYIDARATQASVLGEAVDRLVAQGLDWQRRGLLSGPGPILVGIGASLAAAAPAVWSMRTRGIAAQRLAAGDQPLPFPVEDRPVFGISQSGRSAETLAVLQSVAPDRRRAVVNVAPTPLTEFVPDSFLLGNIEDSYASTIGYTATVAALSVLGDLWNDGTVSADWESLPGAMAAVEATAAGITPELASWMAPVGTADFVAGGGSLGSAEAGALLFREVARVPSTAMSTRSYLHGAMESAGPGAHIVLGDERELDVARTLARAGHRVALITAADIEEESLLQVVRVPALAAGPRAVLEALVLQSLVGELAGARGLDIEEFVFHHTDTKVAAGS